MRRPLRKFSRSTHSTLSEVNIVPLLNLAFVLLVIFVVTTAPVVHDLDMELPRAAKRLKDPKPKINYVSVDASGQMFLNRQPVDTLELLDLLIEMRQTDHDLNVVVRGDGRTRYGQVVAVLDALQQANIGKVNLATEPGE